MTDTKLAVARNALRGAIGRLQAAQGELERRNEPLRELGAMMRQTTAARQRADALRQTDVEALAAWLAAADGSPRPLPPPDLAEAETAAAEAKRTAEAAEIAITRLQPAMNTAAERVREAAAERDGVAFNVVVALAEGMAADIGVLLCTTIAPKVAELRGIIAAARIHQARDGADSSVRGAAGNAAERIEIALREVLQTPNQPAATEAAARFFDRLKGDPTATI